MSWLIEAEIGAEKLTVHVEPDLFGRRAWWLFSRLQRELRESNTAGFVRVSWEAS